MIDLNELVNLPTIKSEFSFTLSTDFYKGVLILFFAFVLVPLLLKKYS